MEKTFFQNIRLHDAIELPDSLEISETTEEDDESLMGFDINRIPPRIFRNIPAARNALVKEVNDLLEPDGEGLPALKIIK